MNASYRYDPYFSRTKDFRQTFKVTILNYTELCSSILNADSLLMMSQNSNGQYGMTSSVYGSSAENGSEAVICYHVAWSDSNNDL